MPIKTVFTVNNALRRNTIPQKHKEAKKQEEHFLSTHSNLAQIKKK